MAPTKDNTAFSNPYSKENKEKRKAGWRGKETFHRMMRNMNTEKPKPPKKPVHSLRSALAAVLRNANRERKNASSDKAKKGSWQKTTSIFIDGMVDLVKKSVGLSENGKHDRYGKWPAFAYPPVLQPSKDPINFLGLIGDERHLNALIRALIREDFALPDLMIWAPRKSRLLCSLEIDSIIHSYTVDCRPQCTSSTVYSH
jgi:hypothetical protein